MAGILATRASIPYLCLSTSIEHLVLYLYSITVWTWTCNWRWSLQPLYEVFSLLSMQQSGVLFSLILGDKAANISQAPITDEHLFYHPSTLVR